MSANLSLTPRPRAIPISFLPLPAPLTPSSQISTLALPLPLLSPSAPPRAVQIPAAPAPPTLPRALAPCLSPSARAAASSPTPSADPRLCPPCPSCPSSHGAAQSSAGSATVRPCLFQGSAETVRPRTPSTAVPLPVRRLHAHPPTPGQTPPPLLSPSLLAPPSLTARSLPFPSAHGDAQPVAHDAHVPHPPRDTGASAERPPLRVDEMNFERCFRCGHEVARAAARLDDVDGWGRQWVCRRACEDEGWDEA